MAIKRQQPRSRRQVGFYRIKPPTAAIQALSERGLDAVEVTASNLNDPARLSVLSVIVFIQRTEKMLEIASDLKAHADRLLNYGCGIVIRPASPQVVSPGQPGINPLKIVTDAVSLLSLPTANLPHDVLQSADWQKRELAPPYPRVDLFMPNVDWSYIANEVTNNDPCQPPNVALEITIENGSRDLTGVERLLLQRAFSDSLKVHLIEMRGGHSGGAVYRALPERPSAPNLNLPHPLPHFVKFGGRIKVLAEYENYENAVDPYIPFHVGPHLDKDRCCLGSVEGIIVGDYVAGAEILSPCARANRAGSAIASLFETTLHGWYRAAIRKENTSIWAELAFKFPNPNRFPASRLARARELGSTKTLEQLRTLLSSIALGPFMVGVIHGDLHAQNILVRANDAIVIDFFAQCTAPILFDMASLEASLAIDSFWVDNWQEASWLASIEPLYIRNPFPITPPHSSPHDPFLWFHEAVHRIRRQAHHYELVSNQYACALALALVNKASKDRTAPEPENSSRAIAYLLAEKILTNI